MALTFPAIDPVAFSVFGLPVRWYALAYLCGFILGWRYALCIAGWDGKKGKGNPVSRSAIDDFFPWAIVGVILGGRAGYVLFYQFGAYMENPLEILKIWHGGMSFHGGALGVIVAMALYAARRRIPFLRLTDIICAVVPVGLFFGRIANFINGELWGRASSVPWAVIFPRAGLQPRHPSQLYESVLEGLVLGLVLFLLARREGVRHKPGIITGFFLVGYGLARIAVEFFREPDVQIGFLLGGATMGQILSVPMIIVGAALVAFAQSRKPA